MKSRNETERTRRRQNMSRSSPIRSSEHRQCGLEHLHRLAWDRQLMMDEFHQSIRLLEHRAAAYLSVCLLLAWCVYRDYKTHSTYIKKFIIFLHTTPPAVALLLLTCSPYSVIFFLLIISLTSSWLLLARSCFFCFFFFFSIILLRAMGYLDMLSSHLLFSYLCGNVITSGSLSVARLLYIFWLLFCMKPDGCLAAVLRPGLPEGHNPRIFIHSVTPSSCWLLDSYHQHQSDPGRPLCGS